MNTRRLALLVVAVSLVAPLHAAAGALGEARVAAQNSGAFDGSRDRTGSDPVRAGSTGDKRTAEQIAASEQARSGNPKQVNLTAPASGEDKEIPAPKPNTWLTWPLAIRAVCGALVGLVIGSLFGPVGLILGPIIGAALFYGVSKAMTTDE